MRGRWHGGHREEKGPREFTVRTSIGRLAVAECGLCGALSIQDAGQLQHMAFHAATGTFGVPDDGDLPET